MNAKTFLGQAYRIDQRINSKMEQISCLRELAEKATHTLKTQPLSSTRNTHLMEHIIVKIIDLENELNTEIDKLIELKREIIGVIKAVKSSECQILLELRYLCFMNWAKIAIEMNYSNQHIYRLHDKALHTVASMIGGRYEL